MGNFYNFDKELYNMTDLTISENNMVFSRKVISNILHNVSGYIINNLISPVIYLPFDLYNIVSDSPNYMISGFDEKQSVGTLLGYKVFIDNDLENNQYFIGKEGEIEIIRRKDKINKILSRI